MTTALTTARDLASDGAIVAAHDKDRKLLLPALADFAQVRVALLEHVQDMITTMENGSLRQVGRPIQLDAPLAS